MSEQPEIINIPQWDLADRMRKALRQAGMSNNEMAEYLEVAPATVSTWINGRFRPSKQSIRLWAMRTGVSYDWLCHGDIAPCVPSPGTTVSAGRGTGKMTLSSILAFPDNNPPSLAFPLAA